MQQLPKPETRDAFLIPEGQNEYSLHHYCETRLIEGATVDDTPQGAPIEEYEFIYECFRTGARRRWGTYCPTQPAALDLDDEVN